MKHLLLSLLILCPAMRILAADSNDIAQTWRNINSYRVVSGAKAAVQGALAVYAFKHGWCKGRKFLNDVEGMAKDKENRTWAKAGEAGDHGVVSGGMFYTSWRLAWFAWHNAKHALAIK